jgi:hypothetical protein
MLTAGGIKELIAEVRAKGYSHTDSGNSPGLSAISAPMFSFQGNIVGAITAIDRSGQLPEVGPNSPIPVLLELATTASRRLGYRPELATKPTSECSSTAKEKSPDKGKAAVKSLRPRTSA